MTDYAFEVGDQVKTHDNFGLYEVTYRYTNQRYNSYIVKAGLVPHIVEFVLTESEIEKYEPPFYPVGTVIRNHQTTYVKQDDGWLFVGTYLHEPALYSEDELRELVSNKKAQVLYKPGKD